MTKLKLHDYQLRAIDFCLVKKKVYLAVDMGLGKTAIALHVVDAIQQPAFVLAPLRVIYTTWPEEIAKWTPHLTYYILHGPKKNLLEASMHDIILMNYEGLPWFAKQTGAWKRRMIIYDEASMVKSQATKRFKLLRKMQPLWSDYALALSATPAPNSLSDLWSQYYLLDQGRSLEKTVTAFRKKYCSSYSYPGMPVTLYKVRPDKVTEIQERVAPITFRLDAKDHLKMPEISYNLVKCEFSVKLKKLYKALEKDYFLALDGMDIDIHTKAMERLQLTRVKKPKLTEDEAKAEASSAAMLSMTLRQFIQGGLYDEDKIWHEIHDLKLKVLKELMETSAGRPILCAIQFRGELMMIQREFPQAPIIAGGCPQQIAQTYISKWNKGELPLLLCHPASLSHGVNLQSGGHTILWYGLPWSLEQYTQLNGRLHRQGQQSTVVVHHLIIKDTLDEAIYQALQDKASGLEGFLNYIRSYHETV